MRGAAVAGLLVIAAADGAGAQATLLADASGGPASPVIGARPVPLGVRVRVRLTPDTGRFLAVDALVGPEERVGVIEASMNDSLVLRARGGATSSIALARVQGIDVSGGRYPTVPSLVLGAIGGALAGASVGRASGERCAEGVSGASCLDHREGTRKGLLYGTASGLLFGALLSRWERWRTVAAPAAP